MEAPVRIFISYAHADEEHRDRFVRHLSALRRDGQIVPWHDKEIQPGTDRAIEIDANLARADIVVLLVTADFVDSDDCFHIELGRALKRYRDGTAQVIPILVKPVDLGETPLAQLRPLPRDGRPVTQWPDRDAAWADVAAGIRGVATALRSSVAEDHSRERETDGFGRRRFGWRWSWSLAILSLVALALVAGFWPPVSVSLQDRNGAVIAAAGLIAPASVRHAQNRLCEALRRERPDATDCIDLPLLGPDDADLLRRVTASGAHVVALVERGERGPMLRILLGGRLAQVGPVPPIRLDKARSTEVLASTLRALACFGSGSRVRGTLPLLDSRVEDPHLVILAALARLSAGESTMPDEIEALSAMIIAPPAEDPAWAEWNALAHYILVARYRDAHREPPHAWLDVLAKSGNQHHRYLAAFLNAQSACERGPVGLADAVRALSPMRDGLRLLSACDRASLLVLEPCLARAEGGEELAQLASEMPTVDEGCPRSTVTDALAGRAAMKGLFGDWTGAEADYRAAFVLSHQLELRLDEAEAILHQKGRSGSDALRLIGDVLAWPQEHQVYAAFLSWLASTPHAPGHEANHLLLSCYGRVKDGAPAMVDNGRTVLSAACTEGVTGVACKVYTLLTVPRIAGESDRALSRLLGAAGE